MLSTRAKILTEELGERLIFIGPDVWSNQQCPYFIPDATLYPAWQAALAQANIRCKIGRWDVPGRPVAVLVDFYPYFEDKNRIYARLWEDYKVDSLHSYGDYDEASMFAYAAAKVVENYYQTFLCGTSARVVYHANEWMTGLGALYINRYMPSIATVFTTHATSIGRSICGNKKPLYEYLYAYNGDQMADELNMQSKHSIEKVTAHNVDCFTTVSDITAEECRVLLEKTVDVVLPNGFEDNFVPKTRAFATKRATARRALLHIANCLTGKVFTDDALIIATSGRYEFLNKGIDLFLSAISRLRYDERLDKEIVAFVEVPGWVKEPRPDLRARLLSGQTFHDPLQYPQLTHWLHNFSDDCVMNMCMWLGMWNRPEDKVNVIFIPCYLTGNDGILDLDYYDTVLANDLCIFPSYYEPWGYTPLEAIAFRVPCVTTTLAGFGRWVNSVLGRPGEITDGVRVIHRTDYNFNEVADAIKDTIIDYSLLSTTARDKVRATAGRLAKRALWKEFITYYYDAYRLALAKASQRQVSTLNNEL